MCHFPVNFKKVEKVTCTTCRGRGYINKKHKIGPAKTCSTCQGSGKMPNPKIYLN